MVYLPTFSLFLGPMLVNIFIYGAYGMIIDYYDYRLLLPIIGSCYYYDYHHYHRLLLLLSLSLHLILLNASKSWTFANRLHCAGLLFTYKTGGVCFGPMLVSISYTELMGYITHSIVEHKLIHRDDNNKTIPIGCHYTTYSRHMYS